MSIYSRGLHPALCFLLVLGNFLGSEPGAAVGVNYLSGNALGVPVHLVQVDPRLPNIRISPAVCPNFPRGPEDFNSLIARTQPRAAITGAPIDIHLGRPPTDIVINGQTVNQGQRGAVACFGEEGQIELRRRNPDRPKDWRPHQSVWGGGPKLLTQGMIDVRPREEGFNDLHEFSELPHTALGLTSEGLLLLVYVRDPVDLFQLAAIMKRLGCVEAMNLWSGDNCGLAYDGQTIGDPGRPLTHALLVYDDPEAYATAQPGLLPSFPDSGKTGLNPGPTAGETFSSPPSKQREPGGPIRIIQPEPGAVVQEKSLVRALVQPQPQKTYTVFHIDGEFRSASNVPPFDFRFDPRQFPEGEHTIEARLYTQNWELIAQDQITLNVVRPPEEPEEAGT